MSDSVATDVSSTAPPAAASAWEDFKRDCSTLPPIVEAKDLFPLEETDNLISYQLLIVAPRSITHCALPSWLGEVVVSGTPRLTYSGRPLPEKLNDKLRHQLFARHKDSDLVIKCTDGYLYRPTHSIADGYYRTGTQTVKITGHSPDAVLDQVSNIVRAAESITVRNLQGLMIELNRMRGTGEAALDGYVQDLISMQADKGKTAIDLLHKLDKRDARKFYEAIIPFLFGGWPLLTVVDSLKGLGTLDALRVISYHPNAAVPLFGTKTRYCDENGEPAVAVELRSLSETDQVHCIERYVQVSQLQAIHGNSKVYRHPVFFSINQGNKSVKGEQVLGSCLTANILQKIAVFNQQEPAAKKTEGVTSKDQAATVTKEWEWEEDYLSSGTLAPPFGWGSAASTGTKKPGEGSSSDIEGSTDPSTRKRVVPEVPTFTREIRQKR